MTSFPTKYEDIIHQLEEFNPVSYAKSRNYVDGNVSRLSPYISRGVLSTKQVAEHLLNRGYQKEQIEKFIQELAWRDYWQIAYKQKDVLVAHGEDYLTPLSKKIPKAILDANTGINAIDQGLRELYATGYMHNHMRMYVAMLVCNIAQTHWLTGAQWMFHHLLDADPASNMLSWQWVCGRNSKKKYYANQDNINRFFYDNQAGSYLDIEYEEFEQLGVPSELTEKVDLQYTTQVPASENITLTHSTTLLYTPFNLDLNWRSGEAHNRVLIFENEFFNDYSWSDNVLQFILNLSDNIDGIQLFVGSFEELKKKFPQQEFIYKEHPSNTHFTGIEDSRDWMFSYHQHQPSFFKFWNKAKKEMKTW